MINSEKIIIMGANNPQTLRLIEDINKAGNRRYEVEGWIDNDITKTGRDYYGYKILGTPQILKEERYSRHLLVNNITTDAKIRATSIRQLKQYGNAFATLVHPDCNTEGVAIGKGAVVHEGALLEAGVSIGAYTVIASSATICHESSIGECCFLSSGVKVAGLAAVADEATLFLGAAIAPRVRIGSRAVVAAGAVVFEDVAEGCMVAGNPARVIKQRQSGDNTLERFLQLEFPKMFGIEKDHYFADYDILSSSEILHLVLGLEREFGIRIEDSEIDEENLGSRAGIERFMQRKLNVQGE